ncbi:T9SS sorting signal type C domain-containing protein [Flavobacterium sp. NKUCC04_CG]|uniref:T9SS sorting signal type C domain-containing protein n=1 Tax=Flavobacterium sp. NKUCC04_CG TaxID=2842121 RepID=UPI001C5A938E|nr:T9SS sorting signal type C domain-containing protein [Flavobacterium sp. NKUCC04_CG]MBW3517692.1 T9SS sorting signal type C domain-containing protein [Flavobacterium sp. NKUCC04_CG]
MRTFLHKTKHLACLIMLLVSSIGFAQAVILDQDFSTISGTGGNDGIWSGSAASNTQINFDGFEFTRGFKGDSCLKLGTGSALGNLKTPELTGLNGAATLTFRAGAWNSNNEKTQLKVRIEGGGSLSVTGVTLVKGAFSLYTVEISAGTTNSKIVFEGEQAANSRFFIDDIKVISQEDVAEGELSQIVNTAVQGVYNQVLNSPIQASNNPISFQVTGLLPNGITLVDNVFQGTPMQVGVFPVSVIVTNAVGVSEAVIMTVEIVKAIQLTEGLVDKVFPLGTLPFPLLEKTSANLNISYSSSAEDIVRISGNVLHMDGVGTATITAVQAGNENYEPYTTTFVVLVNEITNPGGDQCGFETFDGASFVSNTYGSGSFNGENGYIWNYVDLRNDALYQIDGKGAIMKAGSSLTTQLVNGIGDFSVKTRKAYSSSAPRKLELWINGTLKEIFEPVFEGGVDATVVVFQVTGINIADDVTLEIKSLGAQIALDDIIWTCYIAGESEETIWDGTNWSNGIPAANKKVIIDADFVSTTDLIAKSIQINPAKNLTLSSNHVLTVGDIDNRGSFIINDKAAVIQTATAINTGVVQVRKNSLPLKRLDYILWGSPVSGQNLYNFSPQTIEGRFYSYDTALNQFSTTGIHAATVFEGAKAFGVRAPNNFTEQPQIFEAAFEGVLNNGNYTIPVSAVGSGFNLIGNPYPSTIHADLFLAQNTNLSGAVYLYTNTNAFNEQTQNYAANNFAVYNTTGSVAADNSVQIPTAQLSVAQGFIVEALASSEVLFTNDMRVDSGAPFFNRNEPELEKHRIWMELKSPENSKNQTLVGYIEGATNQKDRMFDAVQLDQNTNSITSLLNDESLAIQGKSLPFSVDDEIALRFTAVSAGVFSLKIAAKDGLFAVDQKVYLKDALANTTVELTIADYVFTSAIGRFDNRFSLVFKEPNLSIDDMHSNSDIVVFQNNQILVVETGKALLNNIEIFDLNGRAIYHGKELNQTRFEFPYAAYSKGIYFIVIQSKSGQKMTKKLIF